MLVIVVSYKKENFEPEHSKERPKVEIGKVNYVPFTYILFNDQFVVDTKGMLA
jgi:hypothetical protein